MIAALRGDAAAGITDLGVRFVGEDRRAQLDRFTEEVPPALRD